MTYGINAQTQVRPGTVTQDLLHPDLAGQLGGPGAPQGISVSLLTGGVAAANFNDVPLTDGFVSALSGLPPEALEDGDTLLIGENWASQGGEVGAVIMTRTGTDTWVRGGHPQHYTLYRATKAPVGREQNYGVVYPGRVATAATPELLDAAERNNLHANLHNLRVLAGSLAARQLFAEVVPLALDTPGEFAVPAGYRVQELLVYVNGLRLPRSASVFDLDRNVLTLNPAPGGTDLVTLDIFGEQLVLEN